MKLKVNTPTHNENQYASLIGITMLLCDKSNNIIGQVNMDSVDTANVIIDDSIILGVDEDELALEYIQSQKAFILCPRKSELRTF